MIDGGIMKDTYVETTDNMLKELSRFQDFRDRNFDNYERYEDMQRDRNKPARLYGTAKIQKIETLEDIVVENMKFRPIIDQTGTSTYKAAKVISDYLRPLCKNEYSINNKQKFRSMLQKKKQSYHIIEQIYLHKKLTLICSNWFSEDC